MAETAKRDEKSHEKDQGKVTGFWQTVPGLITAIAALLTAIGGVLGILVQNGLITWGGNSSATSLTDGSAPLGGGEGGQGAPGATAGEKSGESTGEASGVPPDTGNLIPWERATADLVRQDETSTSVKASTVGLACDVGRLRFENGQQLDLEIVSSIRFDAIYLDSASADGLVTLLDGRELDDPIYTWNCPVSGQNELGPVDVPLEDIRRIDFHR